MMMESIVKLVEGRDLTSSEAEDVMSEIMCGKATEAQISAFLTALRMKGEEVEEIAAFASVMRKFCTRIHPAVSDVLVDVVGTGGDKIKTFNISTTSAFVAAGTGVLVAKHGNRSVTSCSGSADVLEALGLNLKAPPSLVEKSIEVVGMGFMFAPIFHPAMKYAAGPRREIGIRTVFNLLGPLTNPADAQAQLLGVYDENLTEPLARVLDRLGVEQAMVVHGLDGLDEISTIGRTKITELEHGEVSTLQLDPEHFGVKPAQRRDLEGSAPEDSALITFNILSQKGSSRSNDPRKDIVLVNAAAAIYLGGKAETIKEGMQIAVESIQSGSAYEKLKALVKFSGGDMSKLEELEKYA